MYNYFKKLKKMETKVNVTDLQTQIFRLINGIESSKNAKERFLGIIGILCGRDSKNYKMYSQLISDPRQQLEMLQAPESNEYKNNFMVFCHIVLEDYITQVAPDTPEQEKEGPQNKTPEKDLLLYHYFTEVEKASQYKPRITGFDLQKFPALCSEEYSLIRRILEKGKDDDPQIEYKFTAANYRQLLTVWLLHPELICYPIEIEKIIKLFRSGKLEI